jgi:hypothetical protein
MDAGVDDVTEPAIGADTYARWRASTLGRITERVEMKRVLDGGTGDGTYALRSRSARGGRDGHRR